MRMNPLSKETVRSWYEKEVAACEKKLEDSGNFGTKADRKREMDELVMKVNNLVTATPMIAFLSNFMPHK